MVQTRLGVGQHAPAGATVYLLRGSGDQQMEIEWFEADPDWVCPPTINGFWYGYLTADELRAEAF